MVAVEADRNPGAVFSCLLKLLGQKEPFAVLFVDEHPVLTLAFPATVLQNLALATPLEGAWIIWLGPSKEQAIGTLLWRCLASSHSAETTEPEPGLLELAVCYQEQSAAESVFCINAGVVLTEMR